MHFRALRRFGMFAAGAAGAGVIAVTTASVAMAETWRMASGFSDTLFQTQNLRLFVEDVEKRTNKAVTIRLSSNSSLYKTPEIKRAVETGQIQLGEILLSAYGNEIPLFSADVVPYLISGYDGAWKLYQATRPLLEKQFEADGSVMLYNVAWPGAGFFSTGKIESVADLRGKKMRSAAPLLSKFTDRLGMASTVIHTPELAQAFSTGMVNMMFTSSPLGPQLQAWQFTKYYYDLNAIHARNAIIMNKAVYDRLSPEHKAAIREAAAAAEKRGWEMSKAADLEYKKLMREKGMWIGPISPDIEKLLKQEAKPVVKEWLSGLSKDAQAALAPLVDAPN